VTQRVKNSHFLLEQKAKYQERIGSLYQPTKSGLDRGYLPIGITQIALNFFAG